MIADKIIKGFCPECYRRNKRYGSPGIHVRKDARKNRKCVVCGKEFFPKRKEFLTCSWKCGCKIRNGGTRFNKKEVVCARCGNKFLVRNYKAMHQKRFFCSENCYALSKKDEMQGNKNPNFKNVVMIRNCPTCGKEFSSYRNKKYCSMKCTKRQNLKTRGTRYERQAKRELENSGFKVVRSAGSLGETDLIAYNKECIKLIQVKATKNMRAKIPLLFVEDIERLKNLPAPPLSTKELWCWRDRRGWQKEIIA